MPDSLNPDSPLSSGSQPAGGLSGRLSPVTGEPAPAATGEDNAPTNGWTPADEPTRAAGSGLEAVLDLEGTRIAGYQLLEEIHRGGQGVVYKAIQLGTKRRVALKVMLEGPFASDSTRRRFEREVELAASLRHPYIVTILDSGVSQGRFYFAMEFIDGLRLDRYLAKVRPTLRDTLTLFDKICAAINFAHQRGVIHRDLKPPNMLVDSTGEPHILDFGLAKPATQPDEEGSTLQVLSTAGQLLGTVAYMSPEQTIGSQDVDVRSDVYSLGVVFYEALLGELPYPVEGPLGEVLTRIAELEPRRPRGLRRGSRFGNLLNDELETILLKSLEKDPARRYQTAGDLGRDLRHLLAGEPIEAKRASGLYVFRKMLRRHRLQAMAAGTVLVTLVVFLVLFAFMWRSERDAAERATRQEAFATQRAVEAQQARDEATRGKQDLERALIEQTIQRGKLAQARGDLVAARDFYWDAYEHSGSPAAQWALRQYYAESGDDGANVLYCEADGPVVLAPGAALAAFCETPESITVRQTADGRTVRWLRAPGRVTALALAADGTVSAGGPGWARLWRPDSLNPALARELPDDFALRGLHALAGGRGLLLVGEKSVRLIHAGELGADERLNLIGPATGSADFSQEHDELAVPTSAGVELVLIEDDGGLRSELIGLQDLAAPPRRVRFVGDSLFAATADLLYWTAASGSGLGVWLRYADAPLEWKTLGEWDLLDLQPSKRTVVLGMHDGRILRYRMGKQENAWHVAAGNLVELRLTPDASAVLTLDRAGTLTRWIAPAPQADDRLILEQPAAQWAMAEDGSAVLLADERERIFAYVPERSAAREPIPVRRGLRLRLPGSADLALALSHYAERVVICMDGAVRLRERSSGTPYNATWNDPAAPVLKSVALTGDGQYLAFSSQSQSGDRQRITFYRWEPRVQTARNVDLATLFPASGPAVEFVGSIIREMAFVPGTSRLMVARSNSELVLIDAERPPAGGAAVVEPPEVWAVLESPAVALAFDRDGDQLAAAGEDGFIRVLGVPNPTLLRRIRVPESVRTLAFSPDGQALLTRGGDGSVSVVDLTTGEQVVQMAASAGETGTLAQWIGGHDTMLLSQAGGVYEHQYSRADDLIGRNRSYAGQRAVARHLAEGQIRQAWAAVESLAPVDRDRAAELRVLVLEAALRRRSQDVPPDWIEQVPADGDAGVWLRLGHAAYAGERFGQAGTWLARGAELSGGDLDAETDLRLAQCLYLAGDCRAAARKFAQIIERPDFESALLPTVQLQQAAALVLAGDNSGAQSVAARIGSAGRAGLRLDPGAMNAARDIARTLTGLETERPVLAVVAQIAGEMTAENLRGVDLRFHDDVHFFEGELARARGQRDQAAALYQRCIDLARDDWPSNWARYRLRQLSEAN